MRRVTLRGAGLLPDRPAAGATPNPSRALHSPSSRDQTPSVAVSAEQSPSVDPPVFFSSVEHTPANCGNVSSLDAGSGGDSSGCNAAAAVPASSFIVPRRRPASTRPRRPSALPSSAACTSVKRLTSAGNASDENASAQAAKISSLLKRIADLEKDIASSSPESVEARNETIHYQTLTRQSAKRYRFWKKKAEQLACELKDARATQLASTSAAPAADANPRSGVYAAPIGTGTLEWESAPPPVAATPIGPQAANEVQRASSRVGHGASAAKNASSSVPATASGPSSEVPREVAPSRKTVHPMSPAADTC
eukprot:3351182-Pleurochrysis_carterae.AAC.3